MGKSDKPKKAERDNLRYIITLFSRHLKGQRKLFLLAMIMLIAEAATSILESYPLAYLIDFLKGDRPDLVAVLGLPLSGSPMIITVALLTTGIILMAMINSLGDSMAEIYLARGGRMLGYNLRAALYSQLQRLSLAFHDQRRTGDILTRITGDVGEVEDFIIGSFSDIVGSILVLAGTLAFLVYHSWEVALVGAVIVPFMALISNYFAQRIKTASKKQRAREGDLASVTQEMLASIRVIQTYSRHDHELRRFAEHNQKNVEAALVAAVLQARFSWVVKVFEAVAISAVVWLGLWMLNRSDFTVGMLLMFIVLIQNMFKPTRKIIKEWNTIGKIYASVERIGELLDRKPTVTDAPNAIPAPVFRGDIEFQAVSFAYQADLEDEDEDAAVAENNVRQALQDVSFGIDVGQVLALVGHTGAGKSTIIQLLPRLYDPSHGRILIDGQDIRRFTLESLRNQISVVLQESILFNGTVAENIAYGRTDASDEEIVNAAIQANAHEFIKKLPDGYTTLLGERGANLSGGQRQRIAIARAFIRNTPLLILDEPTTGLDADSAELVLLALRTLMKGKTTIIISHDLKLVRQADKIVVLKAGQIEEMGTHRQLVQSNGVYANLYLKQFGQNALDEEHTAPALHDLLGNPLLHQRLPSLADAFDGERMRSELQKALFANNSQRYQIERCQPGKATYLGDQGCALRYDLAVKDLQTGQTLTPTILARVMPNTMSAEVYLRERLLPLAEQMSGRPEVAIFTTPVALLYSHNIILHAFPIDPELPVLLAATDSRKMTAILQTTLPEAVTRQFELENCFIEAGHYGRQHRCVLRYEVEGRWAHTQQRSRQVIFGKVAADQRGELVGPVLTALHRRMEQSSNVVRFTLPRPLGYRPEMRLMLMEAIPGEPLLSKLIKARVENRPAPAGTELTVEAAVGECARVLTTLHGSQIPFGEPRRLTHEMADLQEPLPVMQQLSPALALQVQDALRRLKPYTEPSEALPLCFSHGDYTHTQLLLAGPSCGLVDFDTVCQAEPALDLGQFLAYLRLAVYKAQQNAGLERSDLADQLCEHFLATYLTTARYPRAEAEPLRARAAVYEVVSLLRITVHSWQKLKESRLEQVITILEERIPCLPLISITPRPRKTALPWLAGTSTRRQPG